MSESPLTDVRQYLNLVVISVVTLPPIFFFDFNSFIICFSCTPVNNLNVTLALDAGSSTANSLEFICSSGTFLNGQIASVKIYNKALTDKEIRQNYEAHKPRFNK